MPARLDQALAAKEQEQQQQVGRELLSGLSLWPKRRTCSTLGDMLPAFPGRTLETCRKEMLPETQDPGVVLLALL